MSGLNRSAYYMGHYLDAGAPEHDRILRHFRTVNVQIHLAHDNGILNSRLARQRHPHRHNKTLIR